MVSLQNPHTIVDDRPSQLGNHNQIDPKQCLEYKTKKRNSSEDPTDELIQNEVAFG
jgi:hypothetical protein